MSTPVGSFDSLDAFDLASASPDLAASDQAPAPADQSQLDVIEPGTSPEPTDQGEPSSSIPPVITFNPVASPGISVPAIYLTLEDNIQLTAWNSNATLQNLRVTLRILKPDGKIVIGSFTHPGLTSDRSAQSISIGQLEGYLLGAVVGPPTVPTVRGECWVTLSLIRGTVTSPLMVQQLVADYVSSGVQPGWPTAGVQSPVDGAGKVYQIGGGAPAAGVEASQTVPARARWQVNSVAVHLLADAVAGNRQVILEINVPAGPDVFIPPPNTQAAGAGVFYTWSPGIATNGAVPLHQLIALPSPLVLPAGTIITTSTPGLDAGDQYTPLGLIVQEWIDV